jgi:acyl transferase domain-containing protein/trans-aconitate methyltransferase/acyl carrier protein
MSDLLDRIAQMSPKRLALLALDLDERLRAAEAARHEPIAIVGIGCRFPGAPTPAAYWTLLRDGVDAVREVPADRWDVDALFDADPDAPGRLSSRWGGFLDDIRGFDAAFFGISRREALSLDPQQRLVLEVCWEAIEHAGMSADALHGSDTGVFMGVCGSDYAELLGLRDSASIDAYQASGNASSVLSGRVSYLLGLHGPSVSVDTACSSSLVAVHLACQSLRTGECRTALAGGANVMITPRATIALSKAHMMAADGRCKTFDAAGDGFVRGEGCGVVVLKRLSDADADRDRILAVIRGSAINQDGRSSGLTAPNGPAQERVIRAALAVGGIEPAAVDYVEAHGTGTALGDPIEVKALGAALGVGRPADRPVLIGSVKTNIGHLESAAGVAGLIKLVLAIEHGEIPRHLHFTTPNPHIAWNDTPVRVVTEPTTWKAGDRPRIAGLSSFGFSGTNAHVIVEEPPARSVPAVPIDRPLHVLTLSARSVPALRRQARAWADALEPGTWPLADVCYTAAAGRAHMAERLAFVAESTAGAARVLAAVAAGETPTGVVERRVPTDAPPVVFLFTGQGSQYAGMGRQLDETQPTFTGALDRCDALMSGEMGVSLRSVLFDTADAGRIDRTAFTQPALFALEYALTELWRSWGIEPAAVAGHSLGEIAAACAAGALPLEDAAALVVARAKLMGALPAGGAMAAIFSTPERVAAMLVPHDGRVAVAAINGPDHVVISGEAAAVDAVRRTFEAEGVRARALTVSHAFHSPLVAPMVDAFRDAARRLHPVRARIDMASNVTGDVMGAADVMDADYWARHVMAPVRFADSLRALYDRGYRVFVEIGPAPTLLAMGRRIVPDDQVLWLPSLRPGREPWRDMLTSLGAMHTRGVKVDWAGFDRDYRRSTVALPTYPFERQVFWPADLPVAPGEAWRDWLLDSTWDPLPLVPAGPPFLREPDAIADALATKVDARYREHGAEAYNALYPALDAACAGYIVAGLRAMGCTLAAGQPIDVAVLAATLGVVPRHRRLFGRLVEILAEDGWIEPAGSAWRVVRTPETSDPEAIVSGLLARFPPCRAELEFTARGGSALAGVLRGTLDPIQVLFPAGSMDTAAALYERAPGFRMFNTLLADALAEAIADCPPGRQVRILEVGAGTGGTTTHVLPRLPGTHVEYVYTDVSIAFTSRAREKYAAWPFVTFGTLDMERDPASQGYAAGSFDVIIAANVLHATSDVARALEHARLLLAPGGTLLLLETTRRQRFGDLTVGYTDGWWRFTDTARRPTYALLTTDAWLSELAASGFASARAIGGTADARAIVANQALIVARAPAVPRAGDDVLVVCGEPGPLPDRLLSLAREDGREACLVRRRAGGGASPDDSSTVDTGSAAHVTAWLAALQARWAGRRLLVVNLWPTAETVADAAGADELIASIGRACAPALHLTQACVAAGDAVPRLLLATRGACAIGDAPVRLALAQAPLWGLGRVVGIEHPEIRCTLVDLAGESDAREADALYAVAVGRGGDDRELAWREGQLLARRVVRSPARDRATGPVGVSGDAAYLVTGGLAGLGLRVAEWLVDQGARTLVLAARSAPRAEAQRTIDGLRARGVTVIVAAADVSDAAAVDRVLAQTASTGRPLRGVIHAAGITDDGGLLQQTWSRFESVMAAKVRGAWLLHRGTADLPIDFFVCFSTGASFLGSAGQSNHAAANMFMDALAHHRRAIGMPALSINWGAWSGIGAVVRGGVIERAGARGLRPIPPSAGLRILGHLVASGVTQAAVLPIDWSTMDGPAEIAHRRLLLRAIPAPPDGAAEERAAPPAEEGVDVLRRLPSRRARAMLREWILRDAAATLGLEESDAPDPGQPLSEMGLDSLMAVELRNRLSARLSQSLPATLLFNYPTLQELVEHLTSRVLGESTATVRDEAADGTGALDDLTEDELAARLASRLSDS